MVGLGGGVGFFANATEGEASAAPIQGFSLFGKRHGYEHAGSGLFRHIVRLLGPDELNRPPLVFLENVPNIIRIGMDVVAEALAGPPLAYDMRWVVQAAENVGALHQRRRWFCLAVRADPVGYATARRAAALLSSVPFEPFDWSQAAADAVPRMTRVNDVLRRNRVAILGNAVVPDAVRCAFGRLVALSTMPMVDGGPSEQRIRAHWPTEGVWMAAWELAHRGCPTAAAVRTPVGLPRRDGGGGGSKRPRDGNAQPPLEFDPARFQRPANSRPNERLRCDHVIRAPIVTTRWTTPRRSTVTGAVVLTNRTVRDLPTQVRFEVRTPDDVRGGQLSAEFVEFLMGYETGWTEPAAAVAVLSLQEGENDEGAQPEKHGDDGGGAAGAGDAGGPGDVCP